jgi:hypothetical protein
LFVTNRIRLPDANGVAQFGDASIPAADGLWCGTAKVSGTSMSDPDTGTISAIDGLVQGGLLQAQQDAIAQSPNDVIIFIHGTDNPFDAAVPRAAYNLNGGQK